MRRGWLLDHSAEKDVDSGRPSAAVKLPPGCARHYALLAQMQITSVLPS